MILATLSTHDSAPTPAAGSEQARMAPVDLKLQPLGAFPLRAAEPPALPTQPEQEKA